MIQVIFNVIACKAENVSVKSECETSGKTKWLHIVLHKILAWYWITTKYRWQWEYLTIIWWCGFALLSKFER